MNELIELSQAFDNEWKKIPIITDHQTIQQLFLDAQSEIPLFHSFTGKLKNRENEKKSLNGIFHNFSIRFNSAIEFVFKDLIMRIL